MLLVIAGMRRSGSTLAYQIGCAITSSGLRKMSELPKGIENDPNWHVVKTHRYHPDMLQGIESGKVKAICTIRDPRDIVVSMMSMRNKSFDNTISRLNFEIHEHKLWTENASTFRYEDFYNNIELLIKGISSVIGTEVSQEEINKISERFSFENNRTRSQQIVKTESDYMFPGHIQDGIVGKWKVYLDGKQARQVKDLVGMEWLEKHGYD